MSPLQTVFQPLIGQLAWSVKKGHGTFLTLEFGEPHLEVREPIKVSLDASEKVWRHLSHRRVFPQGDWHLWIQHCRWTVTTRNYESESETIDEVTLTSTLQELDGQRLISVETGQIPHSCILKFDLGAQIVICPSGDVESDEDQWSLHKWQGGVVSFSCDGELIREERG